LSNPAWAPALWTPNPQPPFPDDPGPPPEPGIEYDPWEPAVLQHADWTCSAASSAWLLNSLGDMQYGRTWNEWDVVEALRDSTYAGAISPDYGLARADMYDLERMFDDLGYVVTRRQYIGVEALAEYAGVYPVQCNGARWYHHTGVRNLGAGVANLANPSPTWRSVGQALDAQEAAQWGSWNLMAIVGRL
jgi:hypothetical protein